MTVEAHAAGTRAEGTPTPFVVAVLAMGVQRAAERSLPGRRGDTALDWSPFPQVIVPVATRVAEIAHRLSLPVRLQSVQGRIDLSQSPGLVLIDPWTAGLIGDDAVRRLLAGLPDWVVAIVLFDELDVHFGAAVAALARRIADVVESAGVQRVAVVRADAEFRQRMPRLVLDARRQFLRQASVFPPSGASIRPRFDRAAVNPFEPSE